MAGAKKESKTARASVRAGAGGAGATRVFGDMKRFTALGGGYCYHYAADGRTLHLKVDSQELFDVLSKLEGADRGKVEAEIAGLATQFPQVPEWATLRDRLSAPAAVEEEVAA